MTESLDTIDVVVKRITHEATGIASFELRPAEGGTLPPFTPGAPIDIRLGNGLVRSYSLVNPQGQSDRSVIAVNLDRSSPGGSKFMHEKVLVGDRLAIPAPPNNFRPAESGGHSVSV